MSIDVKICGLTDAAAVTAAVDKGAAWTGFVFYAPSPRNVSIDQAALLTQQVPGSVGRVGLFVDPEDAFLDEVLDHVELDLIQLHGREPVARVADIKRRTGRPVMKAIGIGSADDIAIARRYEDVADRLLFDAKPPPGSDRPGGNALAFDWAMLSGHSWSLPWMLAGGLDVENLAQAVAVTRAACVDISSGVEDAPGLKNPDKIRALLDLARTL